MAPGSQRGAASIEELVERYERAHRKKSIRDLRKILWWEASGLNRTGSWDGEERLMQELFDMPLAEVKLVKSPPLDYENSGEAAYYIPGSRKADSMTGNIYGKLLVVEAVEGARERRTVDPAYIVLRSREKGEYFIHILPLVTKDAVEAYKANREPIYVAAPLSGGDPIAFPFD